MAMHQRQSMHGEYSNFFISNIRPRGLSFILALIGATPELLVRLSKSMITSRVLAGTIKRSGNDERDLALAASLARSSKDLEEHEYAVRSVADAISPICSSINAPESPFVLHLANVMHLATDVTGVLNDSANPPDILDALERLHPSAAVCGTPRDQSPSCNRRGRRRDAWPIRRSSRLDRYQDGWGIRYCVEMWPD